jgi:hypothetical protein
MVRVRVKVKFRVGVNVRVRVRVRGLDKTTQEENTRDNARCDKKRQLNSR